MSVEDPVGRRRPLAGIAAAARMLIAALLLGSPIAGAALGVLGCATPDGRSGGPLLQVGVAPDSPPVVFERDGAIVGIEADLAALVGERLGRRIRFERYAFDELLPALERGEVDVVMSGVSITPERRERVRFTDPYMQTGQLAVIRAADVVERGRPRALRRGGARVGYERGTTGERFVADELPRSTSFAFEDVDEAIRSLRARRIDYFIHDAPTIWRLAGDPANRDLLGLYQPLTREDVAWAVQSDDVRLQEQLDACLDHWQREGRIEPILDRWMPVQVTVR